MLLHHTYIWTHASQVMWEPAGLVKQARRVLKDLKQRSNSFVAAALAQERQASLLVRVSTCCSSGCFSRFVAPSRQTLLTVSMQKHARAPADSITTACRAKQQS